MHGHDMKNMVKICDCFCTCRVHCKGSQPYHGKGLAQGHHEKIRSGHWCTQEALLEVAQSDGSIATAVSEKLRADLRNVTYP